ncbi:MAG: hypothetical protein AAF467_20310 [Actinomycetota bacterium]
MRLQNVTDQWNHEMATMRGARTRRRWAEAEPTLAGWGIAALRDPRWSEATDLMQRALVHISQAGDDVALRTLMVQLRPGLSRIISREARRRLAVGGTDDVDAEVLSVFAEVALRRDLERRPAKVAANLLADTHQRFWRDSQRRDNELSALARLRRPAAGPGNDGGLDDVATRVDAVASLQEALSAVPAPQRQLTATLAVRAWMGDEARDALAADLGLSAGTVRSRLCRLRARLDPADVALTPT